MERRKKVSEMPVYTFSAVAPNGDSHKDKLGSMKEVKQEAELWLEEHGVWDERTPLREKDHVFRLFRVRKPEPDDTPQYEVKVEGHTFSGYRYTR